MLSPNTIRHTAGCGLVNGPLGNARVDMRRRKKTTAISPAQILSVSLTSSFLWKNMVILGKFDHDEIFKYDRKAQKPKTRYFLLFYFTLVLFDPHFTQLHLDTLNN